MKAINNSTEPSKLPVVAVFDFDGTLTQRDSWLPFLQIAVGPWQFWWGLQIIPVSCTFTL